MLKSAAERRRRFTDAHGDPISPAQVISQPQPTLPPWAVGVGVDGIVTLDAALDERGNVTDVKVLSGPRQLQREAQRAIGLWEFTPAHADGKPVSSHLTLSVQFLPPPHAETRVLDPPRVSKVSSEAEEIGGKMATCESSHRRRSDTEVVANPITVEFELKSGGTVSIKAVQTFRKSQARARRKR